MIIEWSYDVMYYLVWKDISSIFLFTAKDFLGLYFIPADLGTFCNIYKGQILPVIAAF